MVSVGLEPRLCWTLKFWEVESEVYQSLAAFLGGGVSEASQPDVLQRKFGSITQ